MKNNDSTLFSVHQKASAHCPFLTSAAATAQFFHEVLSHGKEEVGSPRVLLAIVSDYRSVPVMRSVHWVSAKPGQHCFQCNDFSVPHPKEAAASAHAVLDTWCCGRICPEASHPPRMFTTNRRRCGPETFHSFRFIRWCVLYGWFHSEENHRLSNSQSRLFRTGNRWGNPQTHHVYFHVDFKCLWA